MEVQCYGNHFYLTIMDNLLIDITKKTHNDRHEESLKAPLKYGLKIPAQKYQLFKTGH